KQALNACVLVDKKCSQLIIDFLNFKHNCGTAVERKFYKTEFNDLENNKKGCIVKFITRLLCCVPIMFMTKEDWTVLHQTDGLKNGAMYFNVSKKDFFDNLPKDSENIKKYITYDEMRIAALIGRYTNIFPINNGSRDYAGEQMGTDYYEDVEVGVASLTGSRFERKGKMEYQDVIIDAENNTVENGYGLKKNYSTDQHTFLINIWEKFWKTTFPTYEEAQKLSNEYVPLYLHNNYSNKYGHKENDPIIFFNTCVQKKRIGLVVSLQLNKIISKYKNTDDKVYISVAGLGSGEWAILPGPDQNTLYAPKDMPMGTFIECLQIQVYQNLLEKLLQEDAQALDRITDIDYAFFGFKLNDPKHTIAQYDIIETHFKNVKNVNKDDKNLHRIYTITIGQKDINFHLSQRTAFAKLKNEDVGKKIEAMYAADSNAFPGNEAWVGKVRATGEASMISSTAGVGALLNPKINTSLLRNIQMY
ncbi:MAG TPA: DUF4804 domain-containing protein, partial [Patescibacteria group bacterium]|nr:DUF4804 domain-containing protein [Patescibacteria group bacterium]